MKFQFTCPRCGGHDLAVVQEFFKSFLVTDITALKIRDDEKTFVEETGAIVAYRCFHCGFELRDESDTETIDRESDAIGWVMTEQAQRIWKEGKNIPINDADEITVQWMQFPAGTPREDIWHWIEKTFDISIAELEVWYAEHGRES